MRMQLNSFVNTIALRPMHSRNTIHVLPHCIAINWTHWHSKQWNSMAPRYVSNERAHTHTHTSAHTHSITRTVYSVHWITLYTFPIFKCISFSFGAFIPFDYDSYVWFVCRVPVDWKSNNPFTSFKQQFCMLCSLLRSVMSFSLILHFHQIICVLFCFFFFQMLVFSYFWTHTSTTKVITRKWKRRTSLLTVKMIWTDFHKIIMLLSVQQVQQMKPR